MTKHAKTIDIDQMIATLPRDEQVLVKRLRSLVMECIPQATEKTYDDMVMPFYTRNRLICFISPPSVVWESPNSDPDKKQKANPSSLKLRRAMGVALGFNQGNRMSNEDGVLLAEGRKQVYMMYFKNLEDIDKAQVKALLFEAAMIDEQFVSSGKARKMKK